MTRFGTELAGSVSGPPIPTNTNDKVEAADVTNQADARLDDVAGSLCDALRLMFKTDPDPLGVDTTIKRGAYRLADVLGSLMAEGVPAVVSLGGQTSEERADEFLRAFADAVSGDGSGLVVDAVTRRASVRCAARLLENGSPVATAVMEGSGPGKISGDLLCLVYALFFAEAVSEFLTAAVAEKIKLAVPVLYLDPTGEIAKRIARKVVELVPNPCEEQQKAAGEVRSLAKTAQDLIPGSIADLLGDGT